MSYQSIHSYKALVRAIPSIKALFRAWLHVKSSIFNILLLFFPRPSPTPPHHPTTLSPSPPQTVILLLLYTMSVVGSKRISASVKVYNRNRFLPSLNLFSPSQKFDQDHRKFLGRLCDAMWHIVEKCNIKSQSLWSIFLKMFSPIHLKKKMVNKVIH